MAALTCNARISTSAISILRSSSTLSLTSFGATAFRPARIFYCKRVGRGQRRSDPSDSATGYSPGLPPQHQNFGNSSDTAPGRASFSRCLSASGKCPRSLAALANALESLRTQHLVRRQPAMISANGRSSPAWMGRSLLQKCRNGPDTRTRKRQRAITTHKAALDLARCVWE